MQDRGQAFGRRRLEERRRPEFLLFICFVFLLTFFAVPVSAASSKKITSVTLHVKSKLESGDSLEKDSITDGEPGDGELGIWVDSDKYEIDSMRITSGTSKDTKVGQQITAKVVLVTTDDDYIFKSGMSKSSVKISGGGGTVTSISRSSHKLTVTLKIKGVKGTYDAPEDAEWREGSNLGKARWSAPDNTSGYYEVILRKGGNIIKRVTDYHGTSYDFYPYMTKAGNYNFRVRTIPHTSTEKNYGKNSEWTDSEDLYIEKDEVSDGKGAVWDSGYQSSQGSGGTVTSLPAGQAGWFEANGRWYFGFPDGSLKKNGWEQIQGLWYCFDENGVMRTGWVKTDQGSYFLGDNGAMLTGWNDVGGEWYYFYEASQPDKVGLMAVNAILLRDDKAWYVDQDGKRASGWKQVGDNWYYFYPGSGEMAKDTVIDTFYLGPDGVWQH